MFMCGDVSVYVEVGVFMWEWECLCGRCEYVYVQMR